jgi:MFS transporter, DHA1 family, multidrug resistance protein
LLLLIVLITQAALVLPQPIVPYYIQDLGAPIRWLSTITGFIVSLVGVCSIISSRWWGARSDRLGYRPTMQAATSIVILGMVAQAFVPSWEWLFPVRTMIGLASGALIPLVYGELARRSPMGRKGGIMGIASSATLMGNLLGPLICSVVAPWIPLWMVFVVSATVMAVGLGMSRRLRSERTPSIVEES